VSLQKVKLDKGKSRTVPANGEPR